MVRTSENVLGKQQIAKVLANCPTLRRVVDDVRTYFQTTTTWLFIPSLSLSTAKIN